LLSDTTQWGDLVLKEMSERAQEIGIDYKTMELVLECFWDIYCRKTVVPELTAKKLEPFLLRVKLSVPPQDKVPAEGEEGDVIPSPVNLPLKAIVNIKIPLKRPVVEEKKGDEDAGSDAGKDKPEIEKKVEEVKPFDKKSDEELYEEMELEDKVWCMNNIGESSKIWVIHQGASRLVRKDIVTCMKKGIKELENLELDEIIDIVEKDAVTIENKFLKKYNENREESKRVPVFKFEIN